MYQQQQLKSAKKANREGLQRQTKTLNTAEQFLFGGLSGMLAICLVHPMDVIKTRMQLSTNGQHKNSVQAFFNIMKSEGPRALYTGLSASLLRQGTYTTTKLGVFMDLENRFTIRNPETQQVTPPSKDSVWYGCGWSCCCCWNTC